MSRILILHVGDDASLRATRSAILRADFDVVDCRSSQAWDRFMVGDFDAVVMCGSINPGFRRALTQRFAERSPSTLLVQMGEPHSDGSGNNIVFLPLFAPENINEAIMSALGKKPGAAVQIDPLTAHSLFVTSLIS